MSFLINPFGLPPTTYSTMAVQDFLTGTSTGAQSFTTTALGGTTPTAVMVIGSYHQAANDPNETAPCSFSVGFIDGTSQRCIAGYSGNGVATTNNRKSSYTDAAFAIGRSTIEKRASGSLVSDGISLNFSANGTASMRGAFLAFAGSGVTAKVGSIDLGSGTSVVSVNAGFNPSAVILISVDGDFGGTNTTTNMKFMLGMCVNDGSATQRALCAYENDGAADGNLVMSIVTGSAVSDHNTSTRAEKYHATISNFSSSGFDITPSASTGGTIVGYLALKFSGLNTKLVDFTTPTSTGSSSITGVGFKPRAAIVVLTNLEALDSFPGSTSDNQSGWSVGLLCDEQWTASWRADSGAPTTSTASQLYSNAIQGPSATDNDAIKASLTSFDSGGMTLNYSAVQGTGKKGFILFIE